jgi:hypothetical protein
MLPLFIGGRNKGLFSSLVRVSSGLYQWIGTEYFDNLTMRESHKHESVCRVSTFRKRKFTCFFEDERSRQKYFVFLYDRASKNCMDGGPSNWIEHIYDSISYICVCCFDSFLKLFENDMHHSTIHIWNLFQIDIKAKDYWFFCLIL